MENNMSTTASTGKNVSLKLRTSRSKATSNSPVKWHSTEKLEGEIHTDGVLNLGDSAVREWQNITAQSVVVRGKVTGNINAKEKIEIKAKAELFGDIRATKLTVEEGVTFVGRTEVNPNKVAPTAPTRADPNLPRPPKQRSRHDALMLPRPARTHLNASEQAGQDQSGLPALRPRAVGAAHGHLDGLQKMPWPFRRSGIAQPGKEGRQGRAGQKRRRINFALECLAPNWKVRRPARSRRCASVAAATSTSRIITSPMPSRKISKTKGSFTIDATGYVFNTEVMAQDAVIKGRFLGKLTAWGR